jgi:hypothetical protein
MELQQWYKFFAPSHLLWLSAGLQVAGALACWFVAEAFVAAVGEMQVSPWPVLRERAAPRRSAGSASVLHLREPAYRSEGFAASAMIERDAA